MFYDLLSIKVLNNQKGVSAVITAIVLAMLLGFTALAIDVGYMYATRNELQDVADAAALAGASELGRIYLTLDPGEHTDFNFSSTQEAAIKQAARDVALENEAAGSNIDIRLADIAIGTWDFTVSDLWNGLSPTLIGPDAVRVIARKDSNINNPVSTFFGKIFSLFGTSRDTFESSAVATAALSGMSVIGEGELLTPIGISDIYMTGGPGEYCLQLIEFSPTGTSCVGWHNFQDPINANTLADKMFGFIDADGAVDETTGKTEGEAWLDTYFPAQNEQQDYVAANTPETGTPIEYDFQGGEIASMFNGAYYGEYYDTGLPNTDTVEGQTHSPAPFFTLFDYFRFRDGDAGDDPDTCPDLTHTTYCDADGNTTCVPANEIWTATVPVYEETLPCSNPNQTQTIIKFASIKIRLPLGPPDNNIQVCVSCGETIDEGRSGGVSGTNVKGSIPNLVH